MARIRAVVTLPWTSNLPEDVSINTFHFLTTSSPASAGERTEIIGNLVAFYNSDFGAAGNPLSSFYGSIVSRAVNACTVELFDLADLEPRLPVETFQWTLGAGAQSSLLPPEVALCASFQANPVSGIPQARRRGRIYLGPFTHPAITTAGRPSTSIIEAAKDAMEGIFDLQAGSGVQWCVYSRIGDAMAAVSNGWVDDEFDTQRRRGRQRTTRTTWVG